MKKHPPLGSAAECKRRPVGQMCLGRGCDYQKAKWLDKHPAIQRSIFLQMFADERPRDVISPLVTTIEDGEFKLIVNTKLGVIGL